MKKYQLYLLSSLTGILLYLGMPVKGFPVILFFAFVPLLFVENYLYKNKNKYNKFSIFTYSFVAFLIWNVLTTWWIYNSTAFGAVMAFIFNSLFMAVVFTIYHISRRNLNNNKYSQFILIFYWISFEYLHLHWDLSWPWLNLGNAFATYTKWVQWYEYTGTFGGTLWILLVNIFIFQLISNILNNKRQIKKIIFLLITVCICILLPIIISFHIYNNYREKGKSVSIVIVQPNIDPYNEKFIEPSRIQINKMLNLARTKTDSSTDFVVFPESAIQENIWERHLNNSFSIDSLRRFIKKYPHLNIVIGASSFKMFLKGEKLSATARKFSNVNQWYDAYNTALLIDSTKNIQIYHKSKLVPGVEKMPFPNILKPLDKYAIDLGGITGSLGISKNREPFISQIDSLKIAPAICYESAYGEFMTKYIRNGANLIFVITNDGWWGNTQGYKQHFVLSILRAVETRRSIVHCANTGISAFINQRGDVFQKTTYWKPAVIKKNIKANSQLTFYVVYGDYIAKISAFIAALFFIISIINRILNRKNSLIKSNN